MQDRFPGFAGLKAFFAVGRSSSVAAAAERLGISRSAVSHQLRNLETELGIRLYDRAARKLRLTPEGETYLRAIEGPMADIRDASERIRSSAVRHRVTLTLTPSFAAGWFLPRMRRLTEALPELELNLVSTTRVIDLAIENVDLAIRRGAGTWPGLERAPMFTETIVPVVAHASVANGAAGSLYHLLRDKGLLVNATLPGEWDDWAALNGIELGPDLRRFTLETYELTIEACRDGLGVALGRRPLVDPLLASDTLVQPFTETSTPSLGYFIVWRTERPPSAMARRLKDWLLAECSAK